MSWYVGAIFKTTASTWQTDICWNTNCLPSLLTLPHNEAHQVIIVPWEIYFALFWALLLPLKMWPVLSWVMGKRKCVAKQKSGKTERVLSGNEKKTCKTKQEQKNKRTRVIITHTLISINLSSINLSIIYQLSIYWLSIYLWISPWIYLFCRWQ